MAGYTEDRYDVNGIDTAVLTAGEGSPLVFFHGAGTATGFDAMTGALTKMDIRGRDGVSLRDQLGPVLRGAIEARLPAA